MEDLTPRKTVDYKSLPHNLEYRMSKMRYVIAIYLSIFQIIFIVLYGFFSEYISLDYQTAFKNYSVFLNVHAMVFIGFGFLMTFLKRYGYGSIGFNFLIGAYVLEWALLIRGLFVLKFSSVFKIGIQHLLAADFSAAAVLISFGAVVGKATLSQLIIMATFEVVIQTINEFVGKTYFMTSDVGHSIFIHTFGAYFGLAVSKVIFNGKFISEKQKSHYHSDLFAMIGTLFLWIYWPSFNSAYAREENQLVAVVNTYLSITASCITTFIISILVSRGRINMQHIQFATLSGGIAVGSIADISIQPFGALSVGSLAGVISTLGFEYLDPLFKRTSLNDSCGVHNLFGLPGIISGIASGIMAVFSFNENNLITIVYKLYPARIPIKNSIDYMNLSLTDSIEFHHGGLGRSALMQGSYQIFALGLTIMVAIVGGVLTGFIMKIPFIEQINEEQEMFDDDSQWLTPDDYHNFTEVKIKYIDEQEMEEKHLTSP